MNKSRGKQNKNFFSFFVIDLDCRQVQGRADMFHTLIKCLANTHFMWAEEAGVWRESRVKTQFRFRKTFQKNLRTLLDVAEEPGPELDLIDSHPSCLDASRDTRL